MFLLSIKTIIQINFGVAEQINVHHYEIQVSKDGSGYIKAGEVLAKDIRQYTYNFPTPVLGEASLLFFRIKSVDHDGKFQYSPVKAINGICENEAKIAVYPNLSPASGLITIAMENGYFDGNYKISLINMLGELVQEEKHTLNKVKQFIFNTLKLNSGKYFLRVIELSTSNTSTLQIQKL